MRHEMSETRAKKYRLFARLAQRSSLFLILLPLAENDRIMAKSLVVVNKETDGYRRG
jgi:hypothetical protein